MKNASSPHEKAEILQATLINALDQFLPTKTVNISSDDSPWVTPQIKGLVRRRQRKFRKHRRSLKWISLSDKVMKLVTNAKSKFYANFVEDLKT